jgi:hypothetical protein
MVILPNALDGALIEASEPNRSWSNAPARGLLIQAEPLWARLILASFSSLYLLSSSLL